MIDKSVYNVDRTYKEKIPAIMEKKYGEIYLKYRREFESAGVNGFSPKTPSYLVVEVTSNCNLRCKMCPHTIFGEFEDRPHSNMSFELAEQIAAECKKMNIPSVIIGGGFECTLHPEICEIITLFKEQTNIMELWVLTNGHNLNHRLAKTLVDLQVEILTISLDAATNETYKKIRGANLDVVEKNISNFLNIREETRSEFPFLRVSFVKQTANKNEILLFKDKWKEKADLIDFQEFLDFAKILDIDKPNCDIDNWKKYTCVDPWRTLYINHNGDIFPCCSSHFQNDHYLGNLSKISLSDAWQSKKLKNLREKLSGKSNIPLNCKECLNCRENFM